MGIDVALEQLQHVASDPTTREDVLRLVELTAEEVLATKHTWHLPRGLTHGLVERATLATLAAFARTLESEDGRRTLARLVASTVTPAESLARREQLTSIVSAVAVEVVRDVGVATERRTWTSH